MGSRGPAPARSDQRRRRNKATTPTEKVEVSGTVAIPDAAGDWHSAATSWFEAVKESGQVRYFEPSDWQTAHFCASLMSRCLTEDRLNAQVIAHVRGLMADLLTTESSRRRAGIELERKLPQQDGSAPSGSNVSRLDDRRQRVSTDAS